MKKKNNQRFNTSHVANITNYFFKYFFSFKNTLKYNI